MNNLWRHLQFGVRLLWKNPGFTAIAAIALALGIGANTAIFSVVYATLLAPLPYRHADRIVMVWSNAARLASRFLRFASEDTATAIISRPSSVVPIE